MNSERRSYREIMKGTAIFGGTQVLTMALAVVRGKLVALLLGAFGMGVSSLLYTALQPLQQIFAMGLPYASVSAIASAGDAERQRRAKALRRVSQALSLLGGAATAATAPLLSRLTFGDGGHSAAFAALGVVVALAVMSGAETAIMQGFRRLRRLALCNVAGPVCGLLFGVPLYWLYGVGGIVPAMVVLSAVTWLAARWGSSGLVGSEPQSWRESAALARPVAALGLAMMVTGFGGTLAAYAVNAFINAHGTTADVGFYSAATVLTSQATALVFTAMSTDFYPHLSQVVGHRTLARRLVSQEAEVAMLLAAPASVLLMALAPVVVPLLLSREFTAIVPLVTLLAATFALRAYFFPLDYVCVASRDRRYYFLYEGVLSNVKTCLMLAGGYSLGGLVGLGWGALLNAATDAVLATVLTRWRYGIVYRRRTLLLSAVLVSAVSAAVAAGMLLTDFAARLATLSGIAAVLALYCLWQLRRRAR